VLVLGQKIGEAEAEKGKDVDYLSSIEVGTSHFGSQ